MRTLAAVFAFSLGLQGNVFSQPANYLYLNSWYCINPNKPLENKTCPLMSEFNCDFTVPCINNSCQEEGNNPTTIDFQRVQIAYGTSTTISVYPPLLPFEGSGRKPLYQDTINCFSEEECICLGTGPQSACTTGELTVFALLKYTASKVLCDIATDF